jgi:hypothetical protein
VLLSLAASRYATADMLPGFSFLCVRQKLSFVSSLSFFIFSGEFRDVISRLLLAAADADAALM